MKHTYQISGMTCTGCQAKVKALLSDIPNVTSVDIDLQQGEATITMDEHVDIYVFKNALLPYPKYQIEEKPHVQHAMPATTEDSGEQRGWMETYKPILLIFAYITAVTLITSWHGGGFHWEMAMRVFMAGFFLVFSFFKMLNLNGFAESYVMYDVIARKFKAWAYIYAFVELGLGLAFALNLFPVFANAITLLVMSVSIIGVLQTVLNKRSIQCACLGAVFNLPMSTVTIIEDGLMIVMSGLMLFLR